MRGYTLDLSRNHSMKKLNFLGEAPK
uniref:Uncharacterized protein n=1 Tax=Rhizophora mucronata TaxID=61149 RepID=A0A2P2NCP8_RHIMU